MLFVDNIVLIDETRDRVNAKLEAWKWHDTQKIPKRERFKYLESIIQGSGDIDNDITHCIGVA
ncbi:hypothetical protein H5410_052206 [Solanum commersonii]|uniref:Uncharacterized protein n=1 Tax=Solanum commersonii TaxID=4109 RepID=A0A9J5X0H6_SOLCO|nr:hypothetical protein H5410_052206 [Solanum commersonii]